MSKKPHFPDFREQLGVIIGLGCPRCEGYITAAQVDDLLGYQMICENCDHGYLVAFPQEALAGAAPKLLAACVRLLGTLMRDTESGTLIAPGSPGYEHIHEALTAIAEATDYPPDFWERLDKKVATLTQEILQARVDEQDPE